MGILAIGFLACGNLPKSQEVRDRRTLGHETFSVLFPIKHKIHERHDFDRSESNSIATEWLGEAAGEETLPTRFGWNAPVQVSRADTVRFGTADRVAGIASFAAG